jgi:aspartyl-tRNA(Asn)/glutamyl-tRNA(Gln) amidotransferase subunit A
VGIQLLAPARQDARLYRVGAVLESLLEAKWGGPLLAQAPALAASVVGPVETLETQEAK